MKDKIFLLSIGEARELPVKYLECKSWWWLRSKGDESCLASFVYTDGRIDDCGCEVDDNSVGVRPALRLDGTENIERLSNNSVEYLGIKWIDISKYLEEPVLLAAEPVAYRKFDKKTNYYDTSQIKEFLFKWSKEKLPLADDEKIRKAFEESFEKGDKTCRRVIQSNIKDYECCRNENILLKVLAYLDMWDNEINKKENLHKAIKSSGDSATVRIIVKALMDLHEQKNSNKKRECCYG